MVALLLLAMAASAAPESQESYAERAQRALKSYTVRSVVGPIETPLTKEVADFLLDRPDLAGFLVRRRKIAPYQVTAFGLRQWRVDDSDGTTGTVTLVERGERRRIYYGEGSHSSSVFPVVHASGVVAMDLEPVVSTSCPARVRSTFEVTVRVRNRMLSGLIKVLRPFLRRVIERKLARAFYSAHEVGRLLAREPVQVVRQAKEFPALSPEDAQRFERLVAAMPRQPPACL